MSKYVEEESVYVEDLGTVWHFHNYFEDFYVDKGGFQISNNLTEQWAHIVAGLSFTFRNRNYLFWADSLSLSWVAYNGSNYADLNGSITLISGAYGKLSFVLHYHLNFNDTRILIEPLAVGSLKYPLLNVTLHVRFEDININGLGTDVAAFQFDNETCEYALPSYFVKEVHNYTESFNHLFLYDNVTWKFTDFLWDWNFTLNGSPYLANVILIGDGYSVELDFQYGDFPRQFSFQQSFQWHDPTEIRYMCSNTQTVNGLTAYALLTTNSATAVSVEITNYYPITIKVYKRQADGTETQIGSDLVWYWTANSDGTVTENVRTWNCPQTSLSTTDAIVVRMWYGTTLIRAWITNQLGATRLEAATWTFYLYTQYNARLQVFYFRHGASTCPSIIENFVYSTRTWHNIAAWTFNLTTRKWNFISTFNFTVQTRKWNSINMFSFILETKKWNFISAFNFYAQTKMWQIITTLIFNFKTFSWNIITEWHHTITTVKTFPFIILAAGIVIIAFGFWLWNRRSF